MFRPQNFYDPAKLTAVERDSEVLVRLHYEHETKIEDLRADLKCSGNHIRESIWSLQNAGWDICLRKRKYVSISRESYERAEREGVEFIDRMTQVV